ncbi:TetR family transcriptional regulator [Duganella sp. FT135W]|uniref:TetR family transcriptional regulator n=1 Tax=Duganella flavida TaxID=2692175 RepID=A0A6L8KGW8_9BURK|nr:TetR/AcrR family transcriptional regulator [Duganella flavida]MYM26280.1 TetR family transcriptional regulator [Duganella flavida]
MGVQERREREKSVVRAAILDAARRISERDGWAKLTIRGIAADIEYSPALIYGYFESKEAVLVELMGQGFGALHELLQQARAGDAEPSVTVEKVGMAYWKFAFDNPVPYQLMHGLAGIPFGTEHTPAEVRACYDDFHEPIIALLEARGGERGEESEEQAELYWAFLHGLISLTMNQRIKDGIERANKLAERLVGDFVRGCQPELEKSKKSIRRTK